MDWTDWIGKRIFVQLRKGAVYSGKVIDVDKTGAVIFISIIDKFGQRVVFSSDEIVKIKEEVYGN
jgi:hypothetical protein